MIVQENVPLAPRSTFKIGGPARFFITATTVEEIQEALAYARERALPVYVLGGGSNVLISDDGFPGVVVSPQLVDVHIEEQGSVVQVTAGAGVVWDAFISDMVERGCAGLEALSGIPGTVGGAVVANAGAYGTQCSDVFMSARVLDLSDPSGGARTFGVEQCNFSYHDSIFSAQPGRYLILDTTFQLARESVPDFSYRDNRFNFTDVLAAEQLPHTFAGLRAAVLSIREKKGVLEHCYQSAGSFFHMPYVSKEQHTHIEAVAQSLDADKEERLRPWAWQQTDGSYKLAPGFLLEYTPFHKGFVRGAVGISPQHTLSIINLGGARASEVAALARDMHDAVAALFSISLEREVTYVGEIQ